MKEIEFTSAAVRQLRKLIATTRAQIDTKLQLRLDEMVTNPSAAVYGVGGARISSQDGATLKLDATGAVICQSGERNESATASPPSAMSNAR